MNSKKIAMRCQKLPSDTWQNTFLVLLFISIAIISCEKVVYFDVDTLENKLVVNSFIQPDSAANLTVSLSTDPLAVGFENVRVDDAIIKIYKNENFLGNFNYLFDGNYSFDYAELNALPGDDFKIEVNGNAIHVLNAPSPAATSSLAIGTAIEQMATEHFNLG